MSNKFKPGARVRFKNSHGVFIEGIVAQYRGDIYNNGINIVRIIYGEDQEYVELSESELILLPKSTPSMQAVNLVCLVCKDTHKMWLESAGRYVPCTNCPTPCFKCGKGAAYCTTTPCKCECHRTKSRTSSKPSITVQPNQISNIQLLIKNVGMKAILEQLISSLMSEEDYVKQLKIDLELALYNYNCRYTKQED